MAYIHQRGSRVEIRESVSTPRGPRSRVLASFSGPLTRDVVARAAHRATRPFDPVALQRRARARGIEVRTVSREPEARALLARLRRSDPIDPRLVTLLRTALERAPAEPLPDDLADVGDWVGASDRERGVALHDLLGLADRVLAGRPERRRPPQPDFPRFSSVGRAA